MNVALWIASGVLATAFLVAGTGKLFVPREKLVATSVGQWTEDFSPTALRTISVLEILGVMGLILPALLGVAPILVPLAAVGLALVMVGAMIVHVRRREFPAVMGNLVYFGLAVFVAWGRFGPEPFVG